MVRFISSAGTGAGTFTRCVGPDEEGLLHRGVHQTFLMSWEHPCALMYLLDPVARIGPQAAHFLVECQLALMCAASSVVVAISVTTGPV